MIHNGEKKTKKADWNYGRAAMAFCNRARTMRKPREKMIMRNGCWREIHTPNINDEKLV